MGKVTPQVSMSLDGFITGPNVGVGKGMGDDGDRLHDWRFDAKPMQTPGSTSPELVQRRTIRVLLATQTVFAVVMAMTSPVAALIADRLTGSSTLAGVAQGATAAGGVVASLPLAALTIRRGRRVGIAVGYLAAAVGAAVVITSSLVASYSQLLLGSLLVGGAVAAGFQARFAATDLAPVERRGRAIGTVVWAATVGKVVGPSLAGPSAHVAGALGLPQLAGPFLITGAGLALSATTAFVWLRPDPLLVARSLGDEHRSSPRMRHLLSVAGGNSEARRALLAIAVVHTVMVSVMNMATLHLHHGGAGLRVIGLVISFHVGAMFLLAPVFGYQTDRFGPHGVLWGALTLQLGSLAVLQGTDGHAASSVTFGLFLLGLGWSAGFVSGSALLTASIPEHERPGIQGLSDFLMQLAAALGALGAGTIVATWRYAGPARVSALPLVALGIGLIWSRRSRRDRFEARIGRVRALGVIGRIAAPLAGCHPR
jgi:MFS family permease